MVIDGKFIPDSDLIAMGNKFLKKYNNIYITQDQVEILKNYDIDINNYNNLNELMYEIEEILNNSYTQLDDLEFVSQVLSEYNYYNNTNK